MGSVWLDLRYALRTMAKTPGLTAVLAITLALGIGASTTIFSVVNSVVLKPLPYQEPDRLVRVYTEFVSALSLKKFWVSAPEFDDLQRECRSCEAVGAWSKGTASLAGGDRPVRVDATYATHQLLPLLGVQPMLGRFFDKSEDRPGDPTVVVLGHDVWQRAFGGDPGIVGRKISLDAMPVTVVGVMPEGFDFLDRAEAFVPLNANYATASRGGHYLNVVARLRDGVTLPQFEAELGSLARGWFANRGRHSITPLMPFGEPSHPMIAVPFHQDLVGGLSTTLWLLQGAVLLVLLISIVNVANLLLARSETRTREVAVRAALGASRRRLVRQFVTESLVLGLAGGALGILVTVWAVDGVQALIPKSAPRASEIALDVQAVMFAVGLAIFASLAFGIAPIMHARRTDLHGALKDGSPRMTGNRARLRVRKALVVVQIALAVVLVISCTVMVRSFLRLQKVDLGFAPDNVLTFQLELPKKTYPGATGDVFWRRLSERLRGMPGVTNVTLAAGLPPERRLNANDIAFVGKTPPRRGEGIPWNVDYWQMVGDDFVETMGMRVVKGRALNRGDSEKAPPVALVNESFVKRFYPNEDPIGKRVIMTEARPEDGRPSIEQTIVGVIADYKNTGIDKPAGTEIIIPAWQYTELSVPPDSLSVTWVVVRAAQDPEALIPAITRVVSELDPSLPISHMRPMDDVMWEAIARPRFLTFLLGAFAGIALLLAAVGIYGVMSHIVAQRTHEIGLRVALGAPPRQVRALILRQASVLVWIGVAIGLTTANALQWVLGSSLANLFYGAKLTSPLLSGLVTFVVILTALLATLIPVRRALRVQPTVALRSE